MGAPINARMGLNTWAAFVGTNDNAAVAGDVAMLANEVTPVLKALRKNGIDVVAIHHHMTDTSPTIYFLHYWGTGPADKLATAFKAALGELGKTTRPTRSRQRSIEPPRWSAAPAGGRPRPGGKPKVVLGGNRCARRRGVEWVLPSEQKQIPFDGDRPASRPPTIHVPAAPAPTIRDVRADAERRSVSCEHGDVAAERAISGSTPSGATVARIEDRIDRQNRHHVGGLVVDRGPAFPVVIAMRAVSGSCCRSNAAFLAGWAAQ